MIPELIDKQDSFEVIRDQIAGVLALEIANQKQLAEDAGKDPALWDIGVYSERSNPWEKFLNSPDDTKPIVNIWYDSSNFDASASNIVERQKADGIFNIDCYAAGVSEDVPAGGHKAGDEEAALNVQRVIRLVRNVLMAAEYTYLGLRGLVWRRWPQSVTVFQPQIDSQEVQSIIAARIAFRVEFNEFSPQVPSVALELVSAKVNRSEDGEIVANADYNYPLP